MIKKESTKFKDKPVGAKPVGHTPVGISEANHDINHNTNRRDTREPVQGARPSSFSEVNQDKKDKIQGNVTPGGMRAVMSINGTQVVGFSTRSLNFPQNVRILITKEEFNSKDFQARFNKNFQEVD